MDDVNAAHFLAVVKGKLISKLNGIFVLKSLTIKLMISFKLAYKFVYMLLLNHVQRL